MKCKPGLLAGRRFKNMEKRKGKRCLVYTKRRCPPTCMWVYFFRFSGAMQGNVGSEDMSIPTICL